MIEDLYLKFITSLLDENETNDLIWLIFEFKDCITWSYEEIYNIASIVVVHKLEITHERVYIK